MNAQYPRIAVIHHLQQPFFGNAAAPLGAVEEHFGGVLPDLAGLDGLVSFGGEQAAWDPALAPEVELIAEAVTRRIPFLGVCLGAQLLARATGGENLRLERRLLTWHPLTVIAEDPVLGAIPPGAHALHWNQDGFEPPPGAVEVYARPDGGRAEGFRVGGSAWGVQFHPEVDEVTLDGWYAGWPEAVGEAGTTVADARAADARHLAGQAALSTAIFGAFTRVVRENARSAHA
ncbi:type 1 glutamine amidotransferase [Solirubrobacter sp. CPCC 204708]|uniref:Type 1 glutamine amidotransferase n=1 Tax=Solirubrobacter deserti TaxID=2282478 RepID=A0ABT4RFY3_9ACTN|nr:type 1 glutamine amidotransferase [Solirubrobacter deserti]MBE2318153.1 type 1 glutamine amidotransferase [Solirubrobacter deserti]MDA0137432.1 type 1 glutamine amidotransferase [Solirubrobacter deserti]